jgi:hypothetical protein
MSRSYGAPVSGWHYGSWPSRPRNSEADTLSMMISEFTKRLPQLKSATSFHDIVLYLLNCVQENQTSEFQDFFAFLEDRIIFSEPEERNQLIVELLEDLKNESSFRDIDYVIFENWLGPETHLAWRWLEKKWQGKKSLAARASEV